VIRPFTPRDALRLRQQQATATCLETETLVLVGGSPLRHAVAGCWPLGQRALQTFVAHGPEGAGIDGFVQARRHREGADADLVFIAPALAATPRAALAWPRLITVACQWLGDQGVQRVHVAIDQDDTLALQIFRQIGFVAYTTDSVFRRGAELAPPAPPGLRIVEETDVLRHALDQLSERGMPAEARARRELAAADWQHYPLGGHVPRAMRSRVWLDRAGRVCGAWRAVEGRGGWWLRLLTDGQADAGLLAQHAVATVAGDAATGGRPLYATARGYEPELNLAWRQLGFALLGGRFRLIKSLTARVLEPAWADPQPRPRGVEAAPTASVRWVAAARAQPRWRPARAGRPRLRIGAEGERR